MVWYEKIINKFNSSRIDVQPTNFDAQVVHVLIEIGYVMDSEIVMMVMMNRLRFAKIISKFIRKNYWCLQKQVQPNLRDRTGNI